MGPNEESEPSDDDMLSLSSQQSSGSGDKAKGATKVETQPAVPARPAEDVDLLGLDGGDIQRPLTSPQPSTATNTTNDLLGDLFGAPGSQLSSGPTSAQSTPKRTASSTSPCPSPRQTESKHCF